MENAIKISNINDFLFCKASVYFQGFYENYVPESFKMKCQLAGVEAHKKVDKREYSTKKNVLQSFAVQSYEFGFYGRIDIFDVESGLLTERKNLLKYVYRGQIFQLFAQCIALREMGYTVRKMRIHSLSDNRIHNIGLPEENQEDYAAFLETIEEIKNYRIEDFKRIDAEEEKCAGCIYSPICCFNGL